MKKTLESAIANAENNHNLDVDRLFVAEASVGKQMVMKRLHARARGRAGRIEKHVSRLRIVVRERADEARPSREGGRLMGQKVNPIGLRLGINRTWDSRWYDDRDYAKLLAEDLKIRRFLEKRLAQAGLSRIVIERPAKRARITIHTARPGVVIGKKGQEIETLRKELAALTSGDVHLNIVEVRKPELDAKLVAENIAQQLHAPRHLPPGDEARGAVGDAAGCPGHPGHLRRPAGRCRDRAQRVVPRGPGAAAHAARQRRFRPGHGAHALRHLRHQGVGVPRRDHGARPHGLRQAAGRDRRRRHGHGREPRPCGRGDRS